MASINVAGAMGGKSEKSASKLLPVGQIAHRILWIRERKVILDADLAELYGTQTRRLNEQVKRNRDRFPDDFLFQLTASEKSEVVANCDHVCPMRGVLKRLSLDNLSFPYYSCFYVSIHVKKNTSKTRG